MTASSVIKALDPAQIAAVLAAHGQWVRGEIGGRRAVLRGADLTDADLTDAVLTDADLTGAVLRGADLRGAVLTGADLTGAVLRDGVRWEEYLDTVVPALLVAGGKPLADVATSEHWACHDWGNCPIAVAFGVTGLDDVPALYRAHARQFVQLFDAGLIPLPVVPAEARA